MAAGKVQHAQLISICAVYLCAVGRKGRAPLQKVHLRHLAHGASVRRVRAQRAPAGTDAAVRLACRADGIYHLPGRVYLAIAGKECRACLGIMRTAGHAAQDALLHGGKVQPGYKRTLTVYGVHCAVQAVLPGMTGKGGAGAVWNKGPGLRAALRGRAVQGATGDRCFRCAMPRHTYGKRHGKAKRAQQHRQCPAEKSFHNSCMPPSGHDGVGMHPFFRPLRPNMPGRSRAKGCAPRRAGKCRTGARPAPPDTPRRVWPPR